MRLFVLASTLAIGLAATSAAEAQGFGDLLKQGQDALKGAGVGDGGSGSSGGGNSAAGLADDDIAAGLKEALRVGTEQVVGQLGQSGGFLNDEAIRIPLPGELEQAKTALSAVGMGDMADDLEERMNRAAEQAIPEAQTLFVGAIQEMSISDARGILTGPDDSATSYFQEKMSAPLSDRMQPIVESALQDAGAIQAYDNLVGEYSSLPFVGDLKGNLNEYVVGKGLDGLFHYVAIEEQDIRANPAARTTEILKTVFGN
ncbi:MAG: DUF4197 domain-containing protein [Pseudomonadota bacterium]